MSDSAARRIALFGGSFDPPHLCHVLAATFVLCRVELDELRMIPTYKHAFGKPLSDFSLRCEMLTAAVAHLGSKVRVDTIESELGNTSYTINTVRAIQANNPGAELFWICGADAWRERQRWHKWGELAPLITPLIFGRQGVEPPEGVETLAQLPDISSSGVRSAIERGDSIGGLVPEAVERLIVSRDLYR